MSAFPGRLQWLVAALALAWLGACPLIGCRSASHVELTVSVAASLTGTVEQVESGYSKLHPGITFRNNFGSSGMLAQQIEQGAPVDLIFSAGAKPVTELRTKGFIKVGQDHVLLRNHLVLIAPAGSSLASIQQLSSAQVTRIAMGDPLSVPAGSYAMQTLKSARMDVALKAKFVYAKDVRQVLAYVESGNAEAGFVYATDARSDAKVKVVEMIDDTAHDPIVYPLAVIAQSGHQVEARAFSDYLFSADAATVFAAKGFIPAAQR